MINECKNCDASIGNELNCKIMFIFLYSIYIVYNNNNFWESKKLRRLQSNYFFK